MNFIIQVVATTIISSVITTKYGKNISDAVSSWFGGEEGGEK